ncbi:MAG: SRPBCC family protein [bacterium]
MKKYEAEAFIPRDPRHCANVILDPTNLPRWFAGAKGVAPSEGYPHVDGILTFRMGPFRFDEKVLENGLPARFIVAVHNAFGDARVTTTFATQGDGTRYRKEVEFTPRGVLGLISPLVVPRNVRREVARAAALATSS